MRKVTSKDYFVRPSAYRSIQEALFEENKSTVFPIHYSVKNIIKYVNNHLLIDIFFFIFTILRLPTLLISLL